MKAVCTTLGCCAAAAAPMPGPLLLAALVFPLAVAAVVVLLVLLFAGAGAALDVGALFCCCWALAWLVFSGSDWFPPLRSRAGLGCDGGAVVFEGVTSIGSPAGTGGVNDEAADDDGRIGIVLCIPGARVSAAKGLRLTDSAPEAIVATAVAGISEALGRVVGAGQLAANTYKAAQRPRACRGSHRPALF